MQQARNLALNLGERSGDFWFLIRDRGPDFTRSFDAVFEATSATILRTAVKAPRMNATCERLTGTLRREHLGRSLILGEAHLRGVPPGYQQHYYTAQPHQGINQRIPSDEDHPARVTAADFRTRQILAKNHPERPDQRVRASRLTLRRCRSPDQDPVSGRHNCDIHRPHPALQQDPPAEVNGMRVLRRDRLGGVIREYAQVA